MKEKFKSVESWVYNKKRKKRGYLALSCRVILSCRATVGGFHSDFSVWCRHTNQPGCELLVSWALLDLTTFFFLFFFVHFDTLNGNLFIVELDG